MLVNHLKVKFCLQRCLSSETARSEPASAWVESYRSLLDQWRLFPVRAELDIALNAAQASSQPAHQVGEASLMSEAEPSLLFSIDRLTKGLRVLPLLWKVGLPMVQRLAQSREDRQLTANWWRC